MFLGEQAAVVAGMLDGSSEPLKIVGMDESLPLVEGLRPVGRTVALHGSVVIAPDRLSRARVDVPHAEVAAVQREPEAFLSVAKLFKLLSRHSLLIAESQFVGLQSSALSCQFRDSIGTAEVCSDQVGEEDEHADDLRSVH